jgi:DNA invertase Pin-like site-specific DNA recombinase
MKRCALYHRVSTIDQDPTLARRELHAAARAHGYRVVLDVEEQKKGRALDRPEFARVMEAARRRYIDAVIVWKLTRFGRSTRNLMENIAELRRLGLRFICIQQGINVGPERDPVADLVVNILAAVAEFDLETISDHTRLGLAAAVRRGVRLGPPIKASTPSRGDVAELREQRLSWRQIADVLGCPQSTVRRVFRVRNGAAARNARNAAGIVTGSRPLRAPAGVTGPGITLELSPSQLRLFADGEST